MALVIFTVIIGIAVPALNRRFRQLEINIFAEELRGLLNYLQERSIAEKAVIYFQVASDGREYGTGYSAQKADIRIYRAPIGIRLNSCGKPLIFYPDGMVEQPGLTLTGKKGEIINFYTEGFPAGFNLKWLNNAF